jgi:hypothetical protein
MSGANASLVADQLPEAFLRLPKRREERQFWSGRHGVRSKSRAARSSRVKPRREKASRGGGKENTLEFSRVVATRIGAAHGAKRDHAAESKPFATPRAAKETASITEGGKGGRLDGFRLQRAPNFLKTRSQRRLDGPKGVGAPGKNRGTRGPFGASFS